MAMGLHPSLPMPRLGRGPCSSSSSSLSSGASCLSYRPHSAPAYCAASTEPYGGGLGLKTSQCDSTDDDWRMQAKSEIDRTMHILGVLKTVDTAAVHSWRTEPFNGVETASTANEQSSLYRRQHSSTSDEKDPFAWDQPRRKAQEPTLKAAINLETAELSDSLATLLCLEVNASNAFSGRQRHDCNGIERAAVAVEDEEDDGSLGGKSMPQYRGQQAVHTTRGLPLPNYIGDASQVNGADTKTVESRPKVAESLTARSGSSTEQHEDMALPLPEKALSVDTKSEQLACAIEDVLVVDNLATASHVIQKLRGEYKDLIHACDTEVSGIDVKKESPVGHGTVICFSICCGPEADFGDGKRCIWVDVLNSKREILEVFKSYWEDASIKKIWHNFSFDRHVLANHGIKVAGFYADTMHLARLWHSGRKGTEGSYSLESLTSDINVMNGVHDWDDKVLTKKTSMMELFGVKKLKKDGTEGSTKLLPPVEEIQESETLRERWICYSSADALCTWRLWESLHEKLKGRDWFVQNELRGTMYDFYLRFWRPFGELLVEMEGHGMLVDRDYLAEIEKVACRERAISISRFRKWASKYCSNARYINVTSDAQIRQLLFGGFKKVSRTRNFKVPNTDGYIEEGKKAPLKYRTIEIRGIGIKLPCEIVTSGGLPAVSMQAMKHLAGKVSVDCTEMEDDEDFVPEETDSVLTSAGIEGSVECKNGEDVEDLSAYGAAYHAFNGGQEGKEACKAIAALCEVSAIDTLISSFIQPLQGGDIMGPDERVHCSLNLNTETGRLSARRPNLQNQPALEKDRYKIRQAFVASPGNSLIVADYGQLELRLLAHLAECTSMLEAFRIGGDFHSRTAMNMYDYIRQAVEKGKVLLEWEPKPGEEKPPSPLLKDVYGAERRKAKMLNFSIAYGKTAKGLSKDWKVSLHEAQETVKLWYKDRPEVREWQEAQKKHARERHCVYTLLGRARHFPNVSSTNEYLKGRIDRAAINTPVQGSAADVAMLAMLEITRSKELNELGWKLLLQVHDEMILEGPTDSAPFAKEVVVKAMSHPFEGKNVLKVDLAVDAKHASSWYAAK